MKNSWACFCEASCSFAILALHYWQYLPPVVRPYYAKRVCIYGPESTGKSTLTIDLARHFQTVFVEEYARAWVARLQRWSLRRPGGYHMNLHEWVTYPCQILWHCICSLRVSQATRSGQDLARVSDPRGTQQLILSEMVPD